MNIWPVNILELTILTVTAGTLSMFLDLLGPTTYFPAVPKLFF